MHRYNRPSGSDEVHDMVLQDIQDKLERAGKSLDEFNLPLPRGFDVSMATNRDIQRETLYDRERERIEATNQRSMMYPEQAQAFDEIVRHVEEEPLGYYSSMAQVDVGKPFFTKHLCTMCVVKDISHWLALGAGSLLCCWKEATLAIRGLVCLYQCHAKTSPRR